MGVGADSQTLEALLAELSELKEREAHYRALITNLTEGVVQQEADGRISACNPAAERILGMTRAQMLGLDSLDPTWRAVHEDGSPYPGETHPSMIALSTGAPQHNKIMGIHNPYGTLNWIMINAQPLIRPGSLYPYAVVSSFADITELKRIEAQLRYDALHDILTGLPTRTLLYDRLAFAASRADRLTGFHYALLMINLDGFKAVNDTLGHEAGDELLVKVAGVLNACVREGDTVARLGGDEFVVLLEDLSAPGDALKLVELLLVDLVFDVQIGFTEVSVSASVGVAFPEAGTSGSALVKCADRAMYRAKAAGRSRYAVEGDKPTVW